MIAYLQGNVIKKLEKQIVIMTQGVGYLVQVGNDVLSSVQDNDEVSLFIHTKVKEDDLSLFGFVEEPQWKFFQQLIAVSGIGAKTAMVILDMPVDSTKRAINDEDITYLSTIPGLGKKTAARLSLELKGKVESGEALTQVSAVAQSLQEEALEALVGLGYDKPSVIRFLNESPESFETAEELVKSFLQKA